MSRRGDHGRGRKVGQIPPGLHPAHGTLKGPDSFGAITTCPRPPQLLQAVRPLRRAAERTVSV